VKGIAVCAVLAASFAAPALAAPPKLVVGVAPVAGQADGASRYAATQILHDALRGLPALKVIALSGLDQLAGAGTSAALLACGDNDACVRGVASQVRTDRLVVGALDAERILRLRLIESSSTSAGPLVRVSMSVGLSDSELLHAVTNAALELFPKLADQSYGTLALQGGLPGAALFVDGEPTGELPMSAPANATLRVRAGQRRIKLLAPGHAPFEATVDIIVGQRFLLDVTMSKNRSPGPVYLAIGGLAAAGVGAAVGALVYRRANGWSDACQPAMPCSPGYSRDRYESDRSFIDGGSSVSTALSVGAGLALVGAAVWYLLDPGADEVQP
jgi:hypothetical protein